jgi:hypothetical protein
MLFTSDLERTTVIALGISDTPKPGDAGDDAHWGETKRGEKKGRVQWGLLKMT